LCTFCIPNFIGISDNSQKKEIFQETAKTIQKWAADNKDSTLQVISMVDNFDYNTALMNAAFYEVLSSDSEQRHKVKLIDVAAPSKETQL
jgi:hypothetical protein